VYDWREEEKKAAHIKSKQPAKSQEPALPPTVGTAKTQPAQVDCYTDVVAKITEFVGGEIILIGRI